MAGRHSGITLVEILIVFTILAIATTLTLPGLGQLRAQHRINSAANQLEAILLLTRSHAISSGEVVSLCACTTALTCRDDNQWRDCLIAFIDKPPYGRYQSTGEKIIAHQDFSKDLLIYSGSTGKYSTSARRHVAYAPTGIAISSTISITICSLHPGTLPQVLIVARTGRVRLAKRRSDGTKPYCPTN